MARRSEDRGPVRLRGRSRLLSAGIAVIAVVTAAPSAAEDVGALDGGALVARVNDRDEGRFSTRRVTMELIDKRGSKRMRVARFFRMTDGDDRKLAIFYESPKAIKDTAFLTFDYGEGGRDDDQWLYLPALRRTRRIASSDRGSAFLGTDFSYEEVKKGSRIAVEDFRFERAADLDAEVDGHATVAVRATPVDDDVADELGYSRVVYSIDPAIWMVRRAEYWNLRGEHHKTVDAGEIREVDGIWTAHRIRARNHENGHRTVFTLDEIGYPENLETNLFTERRLRQGWR